MYVLNVENINAAFLTVLLSLLLARWLYSVHPVKALSLQNPHPPSCRSSMPADRKSKSKRRQDDGECLFLPPLDERHIYCFAFLKL